MNIVYASDDNFAEIMGISMISLFESNKDCGEITVFILDDGISDDNRSKLLSIGEKYMRNIIFRPIPDINKLAGVEIHTSSRWSLSAFSRLFLEKIMDEDIERVIYLDCDMLIYDSLEELYNTDLDGNFCGGVLDCISRYHKKNIGLKCEDNYINSGMMVISLTEWRKNNLCGKFERFINSYGGDLPYVDQGVINGTIGRNIKILDLRYNCYTAVYDFSYSDLMIYRKPSGFYSMKEIEDAKSNPAIVHFTTSFLSLRPWIEGCGHPYEGEWLRFKAMSPWSDTPLRKDNRSAAKKLAVKIYNALPKGISVRIAGALHAWIVPMLRRKRK